MTTPTIETKVHDFLAQKRIAVAGVSRDNSHHPVGNLIYQRLKKTGHDVFRQHDISVIAGACPMMFGPGADFGHTCMRWFLKLTGGLPA